MIVRDDLAPWDADAPMYMPPASPGLATIDEVPAEELEASLVAMEGAGLASSC